MIVDLLTDAEYATYRAGGAPTPFSLGLAALVAAVALFGVSARLRASRLGRPRSPQEIAESRGVTYFEGPKAPPRTPPGGA